MGFKGFFSGNREFFSGGPKIAKVVCDTTMILLLLYQKTTTTQHTKLVDCTDVTKKDSVRYYGCKPYIYEFKKMMREQMCERRDELMCKIESDKRKSR